MPDNKNYRFLLSEKITYAVIALILSTSFALGIWALSGITGAQRALNQTPQEKIDYHLFQLEIELYRVLGTLDGMIEKIERHSGSEELISGDIYRRYSIFWSRVEVLRQGRTATLLQDVEGGNELISEIDRSLAINEEAILSSAPASADLKRFRSQLQEWRPRIRRAALAGMFTENRRSDGLRASIANMIDYITIASVAIFLSVILLVGLLMHSLRSSRRAWAIVEGQRAEISSLVSTLSQELNDLLVSIHSKTERARLKTAGGDKEQALKDLRAINQESRHGVDLTRRVLKYIGQRHADFQTQSLTAFFQIAADAAKFALKNNKLKVVPPSDNLLLHVDVEELKVAILYLLKNAEDASKGGTITLGARTTNLSGRDARALRLPKNRYAEFFVQDKGRGMTPEELANCRKPFFTTKAAGQGSGLGLSLAAKFAENAKGALKVESVEGEGTTVRLFLPIEDDFSD